MKSHIHAHIHQIKLSKSNKPKKLTNTHVNNHKKKLRCWMLLIISIFVWLLLFDVCFFARLYVFIRLQDTVKTVIRPSGFILQYPHFNCNHFLAISICSFQKHPFPVISSPSCYFQPFPSSSSNFQQWPAIFSHFRSFQPFLYIFSNSIHFFPYSAIPSISFHIQQFHPFPAI